eukprot:SAG25_NODE_4_length_30349_cov_110.018280_25_plen_79_part_00
MADWRNPVVQLPVAKQPTARERPTIAADSLYFFYRGHFSQWATYANAPHPQHAEALTRVLNVKVVDAFAPNISTHAES